ncbi:hypothetical protein NFHSH190041_02830 [Shewanella sp. NFH-SH190041]|uniref:glycosyltransferase n=1 Tax=Shewanella sp. NFH-SH190041 TaxID=2950245 RepID=UPI0021C267FF|nr:glycosyltransferase [Shewanella sp. NFH-SH190041]BDM62831.1 hypothetical protein NFHSH190041_02830 [Shewanella sp. NFH-SH190041]
MKKKQILIINRTQFGHNIDTYYISKELCQWYQVTYLCFDTGQNKAKQYNVNVKYITYKGCLIRRTIRFYLEVFKEINKNYHYIYLVYFPFCSLMKLSKKKITLDFRSGYISKNKLKRFLFNNLYTFESYFFDSISVISLALKNKLNLSTTKTFLVPSGANIISNTIKEFKEPKLFYIGTLDDRNIDELFYGIKTFITKHKEYKKTLTLDVVGTGKSSLVEELQNLIANLNLNSNIFMHGKLDHTLSKKFFDNCNIGISFIPITEYFDCQPPTKTHEYINSGLICLGTATSENRLIINNKNGFICNDNRISFANELKNLLDNFHYYDSNEIKNSNKKNTWVNSAKALKLHIES